MVDTDLDPPNAKPKDCHTKNPTNKKMLFSNQRQQRTPEKKQRYKNNKIKVERRERKRKKYTANHRQKMAPIVEIKFNFKDSLDTTSLVKLTL